MRKKRPLKLTAYLPVKPDFFKPRDVFFDNSWQAQRGNILVYLPHKRIIENKTVALKNLLPFAQKGEISRKIARERAFVENEFLVFDVKRVLRLVGNILRERARDRREHQNKSVLVFDFVFNGRPEQLAISKKRDSGFDFARGKNLVDFVQRENVRV